MGKPLMISRFHFVSMKYAAATSLLVLFCATLATADNAPAKPATTSPTTPHASSEPTAEQLSITGVQTLIYFRHGEKPPHDLGQLSPQGLNRALALSKLLPAKFGKPNYLFAPDPAITHSAKDGIDYFYCRALATIEPLAIVLQMPVQTPFRYSQVEQLNAELTLSKYAKTLIFICWEHGAAERSVKQLMTQFGQDPGQIPKWSHHDFDSLYIVKITRTAGRLSTITFSHEREGLDHQSTEMPTPAPSTQP